MPDTKRSLEAGYEVSDMNVRVIVVSLIGLAVMMIAGFVTIVLLMRGFDESDQTNIAGQSPPLSLAGAQTPDGPLLQQDPVADKEVVLEAARARLDNYGPATESHGMHIPIKRAMQLVAEGKVPYRQKPQSARVEDAAPVNKENQ